jgi:Dynein light chain type 1
MEVLQSTLPSDQSKFIADSAAVLIAKNRKLSDSDIAFQLHKVLLSRFKLNFHVIVGESFSYSVKTRKSTVCILQIKGSQKQFVLYCSPLIEGVSKNLLKFTDSSSTGEAAQISFSVLKQPTLGDLDYLPNQPDLLKKLQTLCTTELSDSQRLSQKIRSELTLMASPIWHVIVGTDFQCQPADNAVCLIQIDFAQILQNKKSAKKKRILIYKHSEKSSNNWIQGILDNSGLIGLVVLMFVVAVVKNQEIVKAVGIGFIGLMLYKAINRFIFSKKN